MDVGAASSLALLVDNVLETSLATLPASVCYISRLHARGPTTKTNNTCRRHSRINGAGSRPVMDNILIWLGAKPARDLPQQKKLNTRQNSANVGHVSLQPFVLEQHVPQQSVMLAHPDKKARALANKQTKKSLTFMPEFQHVQTYSAANPPSFTVGDKLQAEVHHDGQILPKYSRILRISQLNKKGGELEQNQGASIPRFRWHMAFHGRMRTSYKKQLEGGTLPTFVVSWHH